MRLVTCLVIAATGCGGGGGGSDDQPDAPACDPSVRDFDVPDLTAPAVIRHMQIAPATIDPASSAYAESIHQIFLPDDPSITMRDQLFVMLPGTNNRAQGFEKISLIAARAGYPVISLAYGSATHPSGLCADVIGADAMMACRTAIWTEKAYGTDVTAEYPGDEPNSINGRLLRLLQYADTMHPTVGADRFFSGNQVLWNKVALAGFSQGALMAGLIGKDHALARLVLFAGGCDAVDGASGPSLAPWCTEARATPATRTWSVMHVDDEPEEDTAFAAAFGLTALGPYANASTGSPSYCTDTHTLESHEPTASPHLSVAHDNEIPVDGNGLPTLAEDYYYLMTAP